MNDDPAALAVEVCIPEMRLSTLAVIPAEDDAADMEIAAKKLAMPNDPVTLEVRDAYLRGRHSLRPSQTSSVAVWIVSSAGNR